MDKYYFDSKTTWSQGVNLKSIATFEGCKDMNLAQHGMNQFYELLDSILRI